MNTTRQTRGSPEISGLAVLVRQSYGFTRGKDSAVPQSHLDNVV